MVAFSDTYGVKETLFEEDVPQLLPMWVDDCSYRLVTYCRTPHSYHSDQSTFACRHHLGFRAGVVHAAGGCLRDQHADGKICPLLLPASHEQKSEEF